MPITHLEFFLEEPSAEVALTNIVPKIVGPNLTCAFHPFQGKRDLLTNLPNRLRALHSWIPAEWGLVVLVDQDQENCVDLKGQLEAIAQAARFDTKTSRQSRAPYKLLNRVVVEELEAWLFGDVPALVQAYPGVPLTLDKKAPFRNPDAIRGGTWEALERVLQKAGHHKGGLQKYKAAADISSRMSPDQNRSGSFCVFRDGLRALVDEN